MNSLSKKKEELVNMIINYGLLNRVYLDALHENKEVIKERLLDNLESIKDMVLTL